MYVWFVKFLPAHITPAPSWVEQSSIDLCMHSNMSSSLPLQSTSSIIKLFGTLPNLKHWFTYHTTGLKFVLDHKNKPVRNFVCIFIYLDSLVASPLWNPSCLHKTLASISSQSSSQIGFWFMKTFPDVSLPPPRHSVPLQWQVVRGQAIRVQRIPS